MPDIMLNSLPSLPILEFSPKALSDSWLILTAHGQPQAEAVISESLTSDVRKRRRLKFYAFPFILRSQPI